MLNWKRTMSEAASGPYRARMCGRQKKVGSLACSPVTARAERRRRRRSSSCSTGLLSCSGWCRWTDHRRVGAHREHRLVASPRGRVCRQRVGGQLESHSSAHRCWSGATVSAVTAQQVERARSVTAAQLTELRGSPTYGEEPVLPRRRTGASAQHRCALGAHQQVHGTVLAPRGIVSGPDVSGRSPTVRCAASGCRRAPYDDRRRSITRGADRAVARVRAPSPGPCTAPMWRNSRGICATRSWRSPPLV